MTPLAITLIITSGFLQALRDFLTKKSLDKAIFVWWFSIISLLFTLPIIIYLMIIHEVPTLQGIIITLGIGIIHFFYWFYSCKTFEGGELSHVYPIMRSSTAFVLIFAIIFLKETVTLTGIIGILLVTAGVYMVNIKTISFQGMIEPIAAIKKEKHTQYAFITLVLVTIYSIFDKVGVTLMHPFMYAFILTCSASFFFTIYLWKTRTKTEIMGAWKHHQKTIIWNGFISMINYPLLLIALTISKVSYTAGLRQISVIFAVLLGGHFLQEKQKKIRLTAATIIFTGAVLITIA